MRVDLTLKFGCTEGEEFRRHIAEPPIVEPEFLLMHPGEWRRHLFTNAEIYDCV
jgi:hypothetical protein